MPPECGYPGGIFGKGDVLAGSQDITRPGINEFRDGWAAFLQTVQLLLVNLPSAQELIEDIAGNVRRGPPRLKDEASLIQGTISAKEGI
jgi:hypothetical protein